MDKWTFKEAQQAHNDFVYLKENGMLPGLDGPKWVQDLVKELDTHFTNPVIFSVAWERIAIAYKEEIDRMLADFIKTNPNVLQGEFRRISKGAYDYRQQKG